MVARNLVLTLSLAVGLASCSNESGDDGEGPTAPDEPRDGLTPTQLLVRASLDLRGVRPTPDELRAVAEDPDRVDAMIAGFVDDPRFGERIKDIFAGAWRTRVDFYELYGDEYTDEETARIYAAIGEEPLNLIAYIALNDLSFTQLVESEDTFVDPTLLGIWPLTEVDGSEDRQLPAGVVRARYTDARPLAGVLSQNAVYWRHSSTVENANRGRTNALSQALLCQSYLDRPIDFPTDLDLTDSESIRNAIANNAACQGCHSTMDPFGSYLWGFMYAEAEIPMPEYQVAQERAWQLYTDAEPAFFGKGGERMVDLAGHIAGDERFVSCAVRRVYEGMLGRKAALQDEGALAVHREAFLDGNLTLKALVRSILTDPSYRGDTWEPRFGGEPEPVVEKVAPVGVVASSLTDLSGYSMTYAGRPATDLDFALRTLAGGSDRGDATNVSTGAVLVQRRLAEAGAIFAVDSAVAGSSSGGALDGYLGRVDTGTAPRDEQIIELVLITRSHTLSTDDPELAALSGVWADVDAIAGPGEAWVALVTAALSDPDHLLY